MNPGDDERAEELVEMLPTHRDSPIRKPIAHVIQAARLGRRLTGRCGLTFLLSIAGVAVFYLLFWGGSPPPQLPPPIPSPRPSKGTPSFYLMCVSSRKSGYHLEFQTCCFDVKDAFLHAYGGYEKYTTYPDDELRPISNTGQRK